MNMFYSVLRKIKFNGKIIIVDSNNSQHEFGNGNPLIKVKLRVKKLNYISGEEKGNKKRKTGKYGKPRRLPEINKLKYYYYNRP